MAALVCMVHMYISAPGAWTLDIEQYLDKKSPLEMLPLTRSDYKLLLLLPVSSILQQLTVQPVATGRCLISVSFVESIKSKRFKEARLQLFTNKTQFVVASCIHVKAEGVKV